MKNPLKKKFKIGNKSIGCLPIVGIFLILIILLFFVAFYWFASTIPELNDEFKAENLTTKNVYGLSIKIPKNWSEDYSSEENLGTKEIMYGIRDNNLNAGIIVEHIGKEKKITNANGKITTATLKKYVEPRFSYDGVANYNYTFKGVTQQNILAFKSKKSVAQRWVVYEALITIDEEAFLLQFYADSDLLSDEETKKSATAFFNTVDTEHYKSPKELIKLTAEYSEYGKTEEGVLITDCVEDITVTAYYNDGTEKVVDDYTIENPSKLEADKTSIYKITYEDKSCKLKIKCSTISENKYKSMCVNYSYSNIARYPDKYLFKHIKIRGEVLQTMEGAYRVAVNGNYDHVVYVSAYSVETDGNILEDDYITIYGEFKGEETYTTIWGNDITIPKISAKYIER